MKGWKTLGFALFIALGGVLQTFDWATVIPQNKTWSGIVMVAIAGMIAALRTVTTTPIGKAVIAFLAVSMTSLVLAGSPVSAADMPAKARAPFVLGYSGSGWYKGVGTFAEMDQAATVGEHVFAVGGALNAVVGYQWANAGGGSFTALQGSCAYHNVGGSNIVGSVTSDYSCDLTAKLGGPIGNIFNWLPSGVQFPTLPNLGSAMGAAHPWIGGGLRMQHATGEVVGVREHDMSFKGFIGAGLLQQYCQNANGTGCITTDTFVTFNPSQDGFSVLGTQQKLGKGYRAGMNIYF